MRATMFFLLCWPVMGWAAEYSDCARMAKTDPSAALTLADEAIQTRNEPADQHCRALALFNLKRFEEAADTLARLGKRIKHDDSVLWVQVKRQEARAWVQQKKLEAATDALTAVVNELTPTAFFKMTHGRLLVDSLVERALIERENDQPLQAMQDLDFALAINYESQSAMYQRARLALELGDRRGATYDLQRLLHINAQHSGARSLLEDLEN